MLLIRPPISLRYILTAMTLVFVNSSFANTTTDPKDIIPNEYIVKFKEQGFSDRSYSKTTGKSVSQLAQRIIQQLQQTQ